MARRRNYVGYAICLGCLSLPLIVGLVVAVRGGSGDDIAMAGICSFLFGVGIVLFFSGFTLYRDLRMLEDTPTQSIRSIPMGRVQVRGKACGGELTKSPLSQTPCHYYKAVIEQRDDRSWSNLVTHVGGGLFYLDDGTGKVLVDLQKAEYDVMLSWKKVTKNLPVSVRDVPAKRGLPFRLLEYLVLPDHWYDIVGTCTENPSPKDEHDRNLIKKGENWSEFLITSYTQKQEEFARRRAARYRILTGAVMAFVCAAILLAELGFGL